MHPDVRELINDWKPLTITMAGGVKREITRARAQMFVEKLHVASDGCWLWTGSTVPDGYGCTKIRRIGIGSHRLSYLLFAGPIPPGLHVDHACHTAAIKRGDCGGGATCLHRRCANPQHLKLATPRENTLTSLSWAAEHAMRTHCVNGHALEGNNLYVRRGGGRACYQCHRDLDRKQRRELAAQEGRTILPLPQDRTHCPHGHLFDEANTKVDKRGWRSCRTCTNERSRAYKARKKGA